jgi:hypothetical protein
LNRLTAIALCCLLLAGAGGLFLESRAHSERSQQPQPSDQARQPSAHQQGAPSPVPQSERNGSGDKREQKGENSPAQIDYTPYGQIFVTVVGVWITWLIYGVYQRQADIYDRQREIMDKQATLMDGQLKATQDAADAAKGANELAQKQLEYAHRARVSVRVVEAIVWDEIGDIIIRYSLKNTGRLPATRVVIFFASVKDTTALAAELHEVDVDVEGIVVAPDETRVQKGILHNADSNLTTLAKRGDGELFVSIVVRYIDGFGQTRSTWKRAWYDRDRRNFEENGGQQE